MCPALRNTVARGDSPVEEGTLEMVMDDGQDAPAPMRGRGRVGVGSGFWSGLGLGRVALSWMMDGMGEVRRCGEGSGYGDEDDISF